MWSLMGVVRTHWLYRWIFCCSSFASYLKLLLEKWEGNCCLFAFFTNRKWFVKSIFFSTSAPQKTWQKKIKGICIFFFCFLEDTHQSMRTKERAWLWLWEAHTVAQGRLCKSSAVPADPRAELLEWAPSPAFPRVAEGSGWWAHPPGLHKHNS